MSQHVTPQSTVPASGPRLLPLSLARLAGNVLFRFVYPFLGIVALDVGLGPGAEGLLITGLAVGGMIAPLASRVLVGEADRPRRRTSTGLVALFLGTVLLGGLAPLGADAARGLGIGIALLAMVVLGAGKPLLDIGAMAYVSARTTWERRGRALATMELTWAGGLLLLAPLGVLAAATSWRLAIVLMGVVGMATIPLLSRWLDPDDVTAALRAEAATHAEVAAAHPDAAPVPSPRTAARSAALFLLFTVLMFTALEMTFGVVGLWLQDVRKVDIALIGLVTSVGAAGEFAGSLLAVAASDRIGKARTAMIGLVACAAGFMVLGTATALPLAIAGMTLGLFGTETAIVAAISLASEVDPARRSRFLTLTVSVSSVSRAVAGATAPLLLLRRGLLTNTSLSALAAVIAIALLAYVVRRDPRLRG